MSNISIFLSVSSKDILKAEFIRETLADCYGFDVFLFNHSLVGSQDYYKEIVTHLNSCEIFIPLLSRHFISSSFCNQETGFALHRQLEKETIIYPISIDGTKSYDLIDHIQTVVCDNTDKYAELKVTTGFFNIIVSHRNFSFLQHRALEGMLRKLENTRNWKAISTIPYTLEVIKNKVTFSEKHVSILINALKTNIAIKDRPAQRKKLSNFLKEQFSITIE